MIISITEAKEWLRYDLGDEDFTINMLIGAAESYLTTATGKVFTDQDPKAQLYVCVLVNDWFNNRELVSLRPSEKMRQTIQSLTAQLQYGEGGTPVESKHKEL